MPDKSAAAAVDGPELRRALGRFATGVTIVTCVDAKGASIGLTVNSFNALSLDPPLVLWSLRESSPSVAAFAAATHFAVNVLAESHLDLSRRFASRVGHKFSHGAWTAGMCGVPVLAGAVAVFECENTSQQTVGDHHLYFGHVIACRESTVAPLVYQAGHYRQLGSHL